MATTGHASARQVGERSCRGASACGGCGRDSRQAWPKETLPQREPGPQRDCGRSVAALPAKPPCDQWLGCQRRCRKASWASSGRVHRKPLIVEAKSENPAYRATWGCPPLPWLTALPAHGPGACRTSAGADYETQAGLTEFNDGERNGNERSTRRFGTRRGLSNSLPTYSRAAPRCNPRPGKGATFRRAPTARQATVCLLPASRLARTTSGLPPA